MSNLSPDHPQKTAASPLRGTQAKLLAAALCCLISVLGGCRSTPGLVSCWHAENSPADRVGANDGILKQGAAYGPGIKGQAFKFGAIGDAVSASTHGIPVGIHDRTLVCWVYLNAIPGESGSEAFFVGYGKFASYGQTYHLGALADHRLFFSQWGNAIIGPRLTLGEWHHVAATSFDAHTVLYLDGARVASGALDFNTPPATEFHIGFVDAPLRTRQTVGLIDEVAVYNRALPPEEIQALFRAGSAGIPTAPKTKGQ
jgi:hypothetical protein